MHAVRHDERQQRHENDRNREPVPDERRVRRRQMIVRGAESGQDHRRDQYVRCGTLFRGDVHAAPERKPEQARREYCQVRDDIPGGGKTPWSRSGVGKRMVGRVLRQRTEDEAQQPVEREGAAEHEPHLPPDAGNVTRIVHTAS